MVRNNDCCCIVMRIYKEFGIDYWMILNWRGMQMKVAQMSSGGSGDFEDRMNSNI